MRAGRLARLMIKRRFSAPVLGLQHVSAPSGSILEQYRLLADRHPEHLVCMQVGDFYEFYGEAAEKASKLLDIALGRANGGGAGRVPFTGFPVRSLSVHLGRLVKQGVSVVVCEQYQEKNRTASFRRRVARIVTPGTLTDPELLDSRSCNYLLSIAGNQNNSYSMAWSDISTGHVYIRTVPIDQLAEEVKRIGAKEVIAGEEMEGIDRVRIFKDSDSNLIPEFYPDHSNIIFDLDESEMEAFCRFLGYVKSTQVSTIPTLALPQRTHDSQFMSLSGMVMSALELDDGDGREGLISRLCLAKTGPGVRLFTERLTFPSMDLEEIERRLQRVQSFLDNPEHRADVRSRLDDVPDYARALQRVRSGRGGVALKDLKILVMIIRIGEASETALSLSVHPQLSAFAQLLESAVDDSGERTVFKPGYNPELDAMYEALKGGDDVGPLETKLKLESGNEGLAIVNLRGVWMAETARSSPIHSPNFQLESSTSNKLRYRHKELEWLIISRERHQKAISQLESELIGKMVADLPFGEMEKLVAELTESDVASASAELAAINNYCRPKMFSDTRYNVINGRHPIVEQLRRSTFVRNSLELNSFALVTGPNMGGKSTFLKQAALIVIMAQAGLFVPATRAEIGLVNAVFTRVGASDDICSNQSTFMVEMSETGEILRHATPQSLILMDEVGRGTAWEEGFALAHAIVKYLMDHVKARCLFATHYSELAKLVESRGQALLKTDAIINADGSLTPLYSITPGFAEHSFAIAVARAAGLPPVVLDEALTKWQEIKETI